MSSRRPAGLVLASVLALAASIAPATAPVTRAVQTFIPVTTLADVRTPNNGACSLAEAIAAANLDGGDANADCVDGLDGNDTVTFNVSGTITLTSALPAFTTDMQVGASGTVTIDGANLYQVFRTIGGRTILGGMTVQHGKAGQGGAISNEAGAQVVLNSMTIRSSSANYGAGVWNDGTLTLDQSVVYGNAASIAGGGVFSSGTLTIIDSTITANSAPSGAGIQSSGSLTVVGGTIARNSANTSGGGGIRATAGAASIQGTIVTGNIGNQIVGTVTRTNSIVQTSDTGLIDTALRDNGGSTRTIRLPKGSPALGIGTASTCDLMDLVDQRSFDRPATGCDIGAVQRDRVAPVKLRNPRIQPRVETTLSGSSIRGSLSGWSFDDGTGMGVDSFTVQRQVDGGTWKTIATVAPKIELFVSTTGGYNTVLASGHKYRYRVRATDQDGNVSVWGYTPTITARLRQETASGVAFSSGWSSASTSVYSGGATRYTTTVGKSARFTFTGRSVALVTTNRSNANVVFDVYIDGSYKGENSFSRGGDPTVYRYVPFRWEFSGSTTHTIRIVNTGPGRLDVDGFVVFQ